MSNEHIGKLHCAICIATRIPYCGFFIHCYGQKCINALANWSLLGVQTSFSGTTTYMSAFRTQIAYTWLSRDTPHSRYYFHHVMFFLLGLLIVFRILQPLASVNLTVLCIRLVCGSPLAKHHFELLMYSPPRIGSYWKHRGPIDASTLFLPIVL
jgi:hypothetical protein